MGNTVTGRIDFAALLGRRLPNLSSRDRWRAYGVDPATWTCPGAPGESCGWRPAPDDLPPARGLCPDCSRPLSHACPGYRPGPAAGEADDGWPCGAPIEPIPWRHHDAGPVQWNTGPALCASCEERLRVRRTTSRLGRTEEERGQRAIGLGIPASLVDTIRHLWPSGHPTMRDATGRERDRLRLRRTMRQHIAEDLGRNRGATTRTQILVWGSTGTGKTVELGLAFGHVLRQGLVGTAIWTDESAWLRQHKRRYEAGFDDGERGEAARWMTSLLRVELLVLDDYGRRESLPEVARQEMSDLLCERADRGLPTWITTNRGGPEGTPPGWANLDERLDSRFAEHGMTIRCIGPDLRR